MNIVSRNNFDKFLKILLNGLMHLKIQIIFRFFYLLEIRADFEVNPKMKFVHIDSFYLHKKLHNL
jgi:hypothetical protein